MQRAVKTHGQGIKGLKRANVGFHAKWVRPFNKEPKMRYTTDLLGDLWDSEDEDEDTVEELDFETNHLYDEDELEDEFEEPEEDF